MPSPDCAFGCVPVVLMILVNIARYICPHPKNVIVMHTLAFVLWSRLVHLTDDAMGTGAK